MPWEQLLAANLAVALGALVQAATGVGGGFIMVPLLALINITLIPAPIMFASLSLSAIMAWRGRQAVDIGIAGWIYLGMIPGSMLGAWILVSVGWKNLGTLFAVMILFAVAVSASGIRPRLNRRNAIAGGTVAAIMGSSAGIGAPILALLLQDQHGDRLRANLAVLYLGASVIMLVILAIAGKFGTGELISGITLMPGFVITYFFAGRLQQHVDAGRSRPIVLGLSAAAALVLLVRAFMR